MQASRRGGKSKKYFEEKLKISKFAKYLLIAFCLQFVFYLLLINVIPFYEKEKIDQNGNLVEEPQINGLYTEQWHNYKVETGVDQFGNKSYDYAIGEHTEGKGIKFIYGYNMVLLVISLGLIGYYAMVYIEENDGRVIKSFKTFLKENIGILLLLAFMTWCFFSSCFAYDPFRSFVGCYNLRDGYFSFMFYGSVLICMILMNLTGMGDEIKTKFKNFNIDPRQLITNIFLAVMVLIAFVTLGDYYTVHLYDDSNLLESNNIYAVLVDDNPNKQIGFSVEPKYKSKIYDPENNKYAIVEVARASKGTVTSSVFNNSNHYGYVLAIAVVVAAVLFMKEEKNLLAKGWYLIAFSILTIMLIINDTFGAYLGVLAALCLLVIYEILNLTKNILIDKKLFEPIVEFVSMGVIIAIMVVTSISVPKEPFKKDETEKIVKSNFSEMDKSVRAFLGIEDNKEKQEETLVDSTNVVSGESEEKAEADNSGSGRGELWKGALKMISSNFKCLFGDTENYYDKEVKNPRLTALKRILFGVGSENMIYEYDKIGIGEGRSHNLILQLAVTMGIPAVLLYIASMVCIFFRGLKYVLKYDKFMLMGMAVMVSYLLTALTGNSGFYTSGYFYIFVGLVVIGCMNLKKEEQLKKENDKTVIMSKKEKNKNLSK